MPNPTIAVAGLSAGASLLGARSQAKSAARASDAQTAAADRGIAEQRRQFEAVQKLLNPFVEGGQDAFAQQLSLAGVNGAGQQGQMIDQIAASPEMQAMTQQGENALLQNASATGGLRGGNTQGALAQFRPQVLSQLINQQYSRLGGLSSMGQNAAAGVGNAGQNMANATSGLMQQQGAAQAGGALAQGAAFSQGLNGIGQAAGYVGSFAPQAPSYGGSPEMQGALTNILGPRDGLFSSWGF